MIYAALNPDVVECFLHMVASRDVTTRSVPGQFP